MHTQNTCGSVLDCTANGCNGVVTSSGNPICTGYHSGCPCNPDWSSAPPPPPPATTSSPPTGPPSPPPLVTPWYCVGLAETDDCGFGGCTHDYALGARNMNDGTQVNGYDTGIGSHNPGDLCGKSLGGWTVTCQGDITQECAGYGVALYNSRSCRTYCPSLGDPQFCLDLFDGDFSDSLSLVLVCDRALS